MIRTLFVLGLICFILSGCGDTIHGKAVAESQVGVFHAKLNAEQFEEIYSSAGKELQQVASKGKTIKLFSTIERRLGKVRKSTTVNWKVNTFNFVTTVVLFEKTEFEHGDGDETFTFRVDGETAVLVGYYINSMDMLSN
jgi:hypothetical protein